MIYYLPINKKKESHKSFNLSCLNGWEMSSMTLVLKNKLFYAKVPIAYFITVLLMDVLVW